MNLGKNYKVFSRDAGESIPAMREQGYVVQSVAGIMKNRKEIGKEFPSWKNNSFYTSDGVIYNAYGEAKIVLDTNFIGNMDSSTFLMGGAVVLDDGVFENTIGRNVLYLPKNEIRKLQGKLYTEESVKDSELWNFLARDNKLLSDYADEFFPEMKKRFGIEKAMDIYFDSTSNFEKGRVWILNMFEGRSNADAWSSLCGRGVQFVGFNGGTTMKKLGKDFWESKLETLFSLQ